MEPNAKKPELLIRRFIPPTGKPDVFISIFGRIDKAQEKLFYIGVNGFVRTDLGEKYDAKLIGSTFRIEILNPNLRSICRDLKIRTIRIVTTYEPNI